ncbi:MAG: leucine--tRNA ligase [Thermoplasmata archaeon]|nr:MAG: leucine--tRNA ligase [Thermoplasmata archaeon]
MQMKPYNYEDIERRWQKNWFDSKIYESKRNDKQKFFIHFAYPGVSGYLHVGHMRGFTYCDIIARYKRMQGYNVLFPAGFHASGIPSIGFAKKVERKDPITINSLREYGLSDEEIEKLKDPYEVVKYFGNVYVEDYWKRFGFLIDYSRSMSTISPGYKKFIQWQFYKLKEKNLLVQKQHYAPFCPNCGPVAVDKSETDISTGGNAEILEFTVIKFLMDDGTILPAATLRPETIFGVTNMWVNPDVVYVKIKIMGEIWICSREAARKLNYQYDDVEIIDEEIPGTHLIGKKCRIPIVDREVPILPGIFADPEVATGIVMSVPAHAPYDYIALVETGEPIKPITIIDIPELGEKPAAKVCDELNIHSQKETEKLDEATDIVYKKEFHTGVLNDLCMEYAGMKVSSAKEEIKDRLLSSNQALTMREFSEEVICRCGEKVVIKQIPDQWFIKYSDEKLTNESIKHVEKMNIYPIEYKEELPGVLEWFDDRACIRKGSWLGTEFPFKEGWIIEPISDSTLYPIYYIISKYVNEGKLLAMDMTEKFFDYIFLGKGTAKDALWGEIRGDVLYWYPVDINLGGKEHKTVHFPVFIMNHVAILPEEMRPNGIFVHWWVTQKGKEKISKSKGGVTHIAEAAKIYGVDAMRLYYSHVGSPFVDIEWDPSTVIIYKNRLANLYSLIYNILSIDGGENKHIDRWLKSMLNRRIKNIVEAFDEYNLRVAANEIFFEMQKDINWYIKRGGKNKTILQYYVESWLKMMTPITPHIAEELWHIRYESFISNAEFPTYDEKLFSMEDEIKEDLLQGLIEDIQEILKVTKITPKRICIYTTPKWKQTVTKKIFELEGKGKLDMSNLMREILTDEDMKKKAKEISKFAGKIINEMRKIQDKQRYTIDIDETIFLKEETSYLESLFNCDIEIYPADSKDIYDPKGKSSFASPFRPAIYIE